MGLWEQELMEGFIAYEKNTINSSTRPYCCLKKVKQTQQESFSDSGKHN